MKRLIQRFGGGLSVSLVATLVLVALVAWSFRYTQTAPSGSPSRKSSVRARQKGKTEEICTDLVVSQIGSGIDLMTASMVGTRRIRRGPIALPVRELVVDRLDLVLPESYFHPVPDVSAPTSSAASATRAIDALMEDRSRLEAFLPSVAGLRVRGLRIARLTDGTNAEPWLLAASGRPEDSRTLALKDVVLVDGNRTNRASSALLEFKPYLRIRQIEDYPNIYDRED